MGKKLYVGNLTYGVTDSTLAQLFEAHGTVQSAQVIMDRDTGRSKGFGFLEMGSDAEAQAAIQALNGKEVEGRTLKVNEARAREDRGGGGSGRLGWRPRRFWRRPPLLSDQAKRALRSIDGAGGDYVAAQNT
jgi:cold-inducible RNA-binding protein